MGRWMLGEPVNATRWFHVVLILVGATFFTRSVTQANPPRYGAYLRSRFSS